MYQIAIPLVKRHSLIVDLDLPASVQNIDHSDAMIILIDAGICHCLKPDIRRFRQVLRTYEITACPERMLVVAWFILGHVPLPPFDIERE